MSSSSSSIKRVFLLAPDFRTLGGFEVQFSALAVGLVQRGVDVWAFIREPVRPDHPYWDDMRSSGVHLYAPPAWLRRLLDPPISVRKRVMHVFMALSWPVLLAASLIDCTVRRRSWRRSWLGAQGVVHGWYGKLIFGDGLTWLMERVMDWDMRRARPDVIDVQHSMLPSGILYGRERNLPVVYTEHGAPSEEFLSFWAGLRGVINQADIVAGRAEANFEGLRRLCGLDRPTILIPQAVVTAPQSDEVVSQEALSIDEIVITAIGRLSSEKGTPYALEAFKILVDQGLPVRLVLAGDGPLRSSLEERAIAWGVRDRIQFTGAFDTLAPIIRATHIVAHPTLNDGRSVSVLEAMAWGRPVAASQVGGIPEIVEDGVNGFLVPPADSAALACAIKRLVLDAETRSRMGRAGRAKFLAGRYTVEGLVDASRQAYAQAIAAHEWNNSRLNSMSAP